MHYSEAGLFFCNSILNCVRFYDGGNTMNQLTTAIFFVVVLSTRTRKVNAGRTRSAGMAKPALA